MEDFNKGKIKVPGGWQTPESREGMKKLFANMKKKGCFVEYSDYESWEKVKYAKEEAMDKLDDEKLEMESVKDILADPEEIDVSKLPL